MAARTPAILPCGRSGRQGGHIPQDRLTYGAAGIPPSRKNLISDKSDSPTVSNGPFLSAKKIKDYCTRLIRDFEIKCADENVLVRMLSGGNMQKVVVARELTGDLSLVIADQPTRGIDVGTAKAIHEKLVELRDSGVAVLLVSADLNEIMELSDSMIVMYDGEIVAYFEDASTLTEAELGQYMLGVSARPKTRSGRFVMSNKKLLQFFGVSKPCWPSSLPWFWPSCLSGW